MCPLTALTVAHSRAGAGPHNNRSCRVVRAVGSDDPHATAEDCGRHPRHPAGAGGARRAAVRLSQLDGDRRRGTDHHRHRHGRQSEPVARRCVLPGRAGGRPLDLPVPRRCGPHRQPQSGDGGLPQRDAGMATGRWSSATRTTSTSRCRGAGDHARGVFSIGDRTLHALRPPVFDSPTTRGVVSTRRPGSIGRWTPSPARCPTRTWPSPTSTRSPGDSE